MAVTRRVFSAGLIVFNLVIKHDAAHAQAAILSKIPWGRIMEELGSGISFLLIIYDHLPVEHRTTRCVLLATQIMIICMITHEIYGYR